MSPPAFLSSFVGRTAELSAVATALAGARLVTLAGAGGCGKTRLAARVAEETAEHWPDGVGWVDLTATTAPSAVPELVARALGILVPADAAGEQAAVGVLARQLAARRVLVCLDNCEHVRAAAADVATAVLGAGRGVTVLATSREPLGVPGERVWRVPPLQRDEAVALFRARAGDLPDTPSADGAVRTACARLDGMPLGVELAAAWSAALSPQEIVAGLDDRFRLLVRGPHGVAARHQTLAASLDWSHDLLDDDDRVLFRRLGVFSGGFPAAAAARVAGCDVRDGLRRLVEKSLLVADTGGAVTRYRMLETVREYAAARLAASGEGDDIRERHLDACLAAVEAARHLLDEDVDAWRAAIGADHENHRAAIEWALARGDERGRALAAELAWFWHVSPRGDEGLELLRRAIALDPHRRDAVQARLLTGRTLVADITSPVPAAYDGARDAVALAEEVGDLRTACLARQLSALGLLGSDLDAAAAEADAARAVAREIGYGFGVDGGLVVLGIVAHLRDRHDRATELLRAALHGLRRRSDRGVAAAALGFLARSTAATGDLRAARELAREGVTVATPLGDVHRVGSARAVLAVVELLAGRAEAARAAIEPVLRVVEDASTPPHVPLLTEVVGLLQLAAGRPDLALLTYERERFPTPGCWIGRARALQRTGDVAAARQQVELALAVGRGVELPGLVADGLHVLAELTPDRAEDLHHEALALRAEHGLRPACVRSLEALAEAAGATAEAARLRGACDRARAELGMPAAEPAEDPARVEGRGMTLDEAIAYARRSRGSRSRPATGWASLTPTERSVVDLAVAGLSNPDIGARLFMSRATVKTHLSHVYAKLGVANRTELASAARASGAPAGDRS